MVIYFDTETTGLRPGSICQLSYVMQDKNGAKAKNMFFKVDYVEPGAQAVHGFSVYDLNRLSNGKTFADRIAEILADFNSADLIVAHNSSFDISFFRAEFDRLGLTLPDYNTFCSMKKSLTLCKIARKSGGYKYPKLSELCAFLGVDDATIKDTCKKLYGSNAGFHDARFDTTALYLAVNRAMKDKEEFTAINNLL